MKDYTFVSNKENRRIKVNPVSLIIYLLIYIVSISCYIFVGGYTFLYILIVATILPIVSIVGLIYLERKTRFILSLADNSVKKNSSITMGFIIKNESIISSAVCKMSILVGNDFYKANTGIEYKMTISPKGKSKTELPLIFDKCGLISVKINKLEIRDILSLVSFVYRLNMEEEICVMPKDEELSDVDKFSYTAGLTQNEENNLKGNDFSDVSNIREYVPGDRIKDIHWKATAKKDELMVKERVRLSENQLALLIDMSVNKDVLDTVLELSYNLIRHSINEGIPVNFMWWNEGLNVLEEFEITDKKDIGKAFVAMYEVGINTNIAYAIDYIRKTKVKLKNYIIVKAEGEKAKLYVME